MTARRRARRVALGTRLGGVLLAGALGLSGCGDMIMDERAHVIEATGVVVGVGYLDLDGSGTPNPGDRPMKDVRIRLIPAGGGDAVTSATTDSLGVFRMRSVPVGDFRLEIDEESVPDSVQIFDLSEAPFTLGAGDTIQRNFRTSFPTYTLEEVRSLPPGLRVFTHGFALNPRDPFGDGAVHLREGELSLRATAVQRSEVFPGDSVRFLGRTSTQAGQPILDDVRPFILVSRAVLIRPIDVSTADAFTALDAARDAELARIQNAAIVDTTTVAGDFVVSADDGSGPVDVVLRDYLNFNRSVFRPGEVEIQAATGLLVAFRTDDGDTRWRVMPRGTSDMTLILSDPD